MTTVPVGSAVRDWVAREGTPSPLGVTYIESERTYNFALYSKYAAAVTLLLYSEFDAEDAIFTYDFRYPGNKTGRVWHCRIPAGTIEQAKYYAYRIEGPDDPAGGQRFDPEKILIDPYARGVYFPPSYSRTAAEQPGSNAAKAPLGVIRPCPPFDWGQDHRPRHTSDSVIYEMHVKGFTRRANSGVAEHRRGTFAGVVEKIPYLLDLGVTAVELMPVFQFDLQEDNYWGYMPLNFFSPHCGYASSRADCAHLAEFKTMVRALHEADIAVMLDAVYNHTCEGDERGPNYSYRGIDNTTYYLLHEDMSKYRNDTGTGNVLHCANRTVRKMIIDSMRFWVEEMHVDGFRFDLATIFTRNSDGSINLDDPPVISQITTTSVFENVRLIAEAWDPASYQLGRSFPGMYWYQWNGRFRDEIRQFVRGDNGMVGSLMTRLYGSDDLFPDDRSLAYRPFQSVNYICSHDGFTMRDLVSYKEKRNLANGENNLDGTVANYSSNCGWEGDEGAPESVRELRGRQVKNFCALLMLANGTPMFLMGDEFMQTQHGNNNPWNQDNETTWLDWDLTTRHHDILRFWQRMIAFRKAHPSIARSTFWREDIRWYGVGRDVDMSNSSHTLAYCLHGRSLADQDIYVMINAWTEPLDFMIQEGEDWEWRRVVDTALDPPHDIGEPVPIPRLKYRVDAHSVVVLVRR